MIPALPVIEQKWVITHKRNKKKTELSVRRFFVTNVPDFNPVQKTHGFKTHDACLKSYRWWLSKLDITPHFSKITYTETPQQKREHQQQKREAIVKSLFGE